MQNKKNFFEKKIIVITGAAAGIGNELAALLERQGAQVVRVDQNAEALAKFSQPKYIVDVSNESAVLDLAANILKEVGRPDIWINNAGIALPGSFEQCSSADFNRVMAVNFFGVVYGTRAALSLFKEPARGIVVNMASVSGIIPAPFLSSYVASKHAVVGFTRSLRQEYEQGLSPLRFVLVAPGFVQTNIMSAGEMKFPKWLEFMVEKPKETAAEISQGLIKGKLEIYPTSHGKRLLQMHRLVPSWVEKSSRLLTAKNIKELLGFEQITPK